MKSTATLIVAALCTLALLSTAGAQLIGHARVFGTSFATTAAGTVTFTQPDASSNVTVDFNFTGLPANSNLGFHVHTYGDLTSSDGLSASGHFNPAGVSHGCFPSPNRHVGDMGNITTDDNGNAVGSMTYDLLQLSGAWSIIGRAVVIHAQPDNCTGSTGFAGNRLAYGVIGISSNNAVGSPTSNQLTANVTVASIRGLAGYENITGVVYFTAWSADKVQVYVVLNNVPASTTHGFHIHTYGDLTLLTGLSAGVHFNPFNKNHSYPGTTERHVGDMGNVTSFDNGTVVFNQVLDLITLGGVNSIVGRAVILHSLPDQGPVSTTTGNAGGRIAAGVIGVTGASFPVPLIPTPQPGPTPNTSFAVKAHCGGVMVPLVLLVALLVSLAKLF